MQLDVIMLGGLEVRMGGRPVPAFAAQPVRSALLVYLAVERAVTRDAAMALLWPERDDRRARHALSQTLYELKRALGPDWIESSGELLRVRDVLGADVVRFERAMETADHATALRLCRGPFLEGWHLKASTELEPWVDRQRDRLAALYREACREHAAACMALGDTATALATARAWARREPLDPGAQHLLLTLLLDTGDPHTALRHYRGYERRLRAEDLEPLPETLRLRDRIEGRARESPTGMERHPGRRLRRVAVLPFRHVGREEDRYYAEGLTDELTNELARVPGLGVTARTSTLHYDDDGARPLPRIADDLGVGYLLRGAVRWETGASPPRVRITATLDRVADATTLWGETYDGDPATTFDVPTRIAGEVAEALGLDVPARDRPGRDGSGSRRREAYELYLKGCQHANHRSGDSLRAAAELFQQALALQPDFARAYAGLAQVYAVTPGFTGAQPREWYLKAEGAAERALTLDPELAEAHAAIAFAVFHLEWDLETAERQLRRCLELAPSYATAWVRLGYVLCARGDGRGARDAAERALALDPLSVATNFDTGYQFWQLRDRDRALDQFRRVRELDPDFGPAHFFLGADPLRRGEVAEARREWARMHDRGPLWQEVVARLHAPDRAVEALDRLTELAPGPVHYLMVAATYTLLGRHDRALHWLTGHYRNVRGEPGRLETGGPSLTHVLRDPLFDPLRDEDGFRALVRGMGLPPDTPLIAAETRLTGAD